MDHAAAMVPSPSGYQPERRTGSSARRRRVAGRRVPASSLLPSAASTSLFMPVPGPASSVRSRRWTRSCPSERPAQGMGRGLVNVERGAGEVARSADDAGAGRAPERVRHLAHAGIDAAREMGVAPGFRIVTAGPRRGAGRGLSLRRRRAAGGVAPGRPAPPASGLRSARRWSPAARAGPGWSSAARAAEAPGRRGRSGRAPWHG